jgi:ssDNA-binding Zn-finger/Zn-ribbon topoisomerase 1
MFEADLYPKQWRAIRREKLERAGYRCEQCGVKHLDIQQGSKGTPYMVYLSIAHKNQYETWKKEAETMVLCQRCHRRYDRQFRRKAGRRYLTPVGYARLSVEHGTNKTLVGIARTFDELRDMVAALPDTEFEVHLVMNLAIVGNGLYHKRDDQVRVLREYGACQGLPL